MEKYEILCICDEAHDELRLIHANMSALLEKIRGGDPDAVDRLGYLLDDLEDAVRTLGSVL